MIFKKIIALFIAFTFIFTNLPFDKAFGYTKASPDRLNLQRPLTSSDKQKTQILKEAFRENIERLKRPSKTPKEVVAIGNGEKEDLESLDDEAFLEKIELKIYELDRELCDIEWQKDSAIAVKNMNRREWKEYLKSLKPKDRKKLRDLGNGRYEVFLSDFTKEEKEELDAREKILRAAMLAIAKKNFKKISELRNSNKIQEPILRRKLEILYFDFVKAMVDSVPAIIKKQNVLIRAYNGFRMVEVLEKKLGSKVFAKIDKKYNLKKGGLDDNKVDEILIREANRKVRKAVWELMSERGKACIGKRIELVSLQNKAISEIAKEHDLRNKNGLLYTNYFEFMFEAREFDKEGYERYMDDVDKGTQAQTKEVIESACEKLKVDKLQPWDVLHVDYKAIKKAERFYTSDKAIKALYKTFSEFGFDISKIHIDRNEREGKLIIKSPHGGACFTVDPLKEDIRLLSAPGDGSNSIYALFHETGHANHSLNTDRTNGYLTAGHSLIIAEAMARFMENIIFEPEWMMENLGMSKETVIDFLDARRRRNLIKFRGVRHYVALRDFDKNMYEIVYKYKHNPQAYQKEYGNKSPEDVLTKLYWDQCSEKIGIPGPKGLKKFYELPQWAGLYHYLFTTAYLPISYFYADLLDAHNKYHFLEQYDYIIGNPEVGKWLTENYLKWGDAMPWYEIIEKALGGSVDSRHYIRQITETQKELIERVDKAEERLKERLGAGFICQGDTAFVKMIDNLKERKFEDITSKTKIRNDIKAIEKITGENLEDMLGIDKPLRIIQTDEVVISDKDFAFGFYSHAPPVKERLIKILGSEGEFNKLFKFPTIILSRKLLNAKPSIRREYIYHELICQDGHYEAIFNQQEKFPENYEYKGARYEEGTRRKYLPGHKGKSKKPFKGRLGEFIKEIIQKTLARKDKQKVILYEIVARQPGAKDWDKPGSLKDIKDLIISTKKKWPQINAFYIEGIWPIGEYSKRFNRGERSEEEKYKNEYLMRDDNGEVYLVGKETWQGDPLRYGSPFSAEGFLDPDDPNKLYIAPELGTHGEFKELIKTVHDLDCKIILGIPLNHLSASSYLIEEHPDRFIHRVVDDLQNLEFNGDSNYFLYRCRNYLGKGEDEILAVRYADWGQNPKDCAQLNYTNKGLHNYMMKVFEVMAKLDVDGARLDLPKSVTRENIYERFFTHLYYWDEFVEKVMPREFLEELINKFNKKYPNFIFLAKADNLHVGDMQRMGFDYTHNKHLLDLLVTENIFELKNFLTREPEEFFHLCAHFAENPDEAGKTPEQFGGRIAKRIREMDKYKALITILYTLAGITLINDGQLEGKEEMQRIDKLLPDKEEKDNEAVIEFYEEILPLITEPAFRHGDLVVLSPKTYEGYIQWLKDPVLSYARRYNNEVFIVMVNYSNNKVSRSLNLNGLFNIEEDTEYLLKDRITEKEYVVKNYRPSRKCTTGRIKLAPWQVCIFQVGEISAGMTEMGLPKKLIQKERLPNWIEVIKKSATAPDEGIVKHLVGQFNTLDSFTDRAVIEGTRLFINTFPDAPYKEQINWLFHLYAIYKSKNKGEILPLSDFVDEIFLKNLPEEIRSDVLEAFDYLVSFDKNKGHIEFVESLYKNGEYFNLEDLLMKRLDNIIKGKTDFEQLSLCLDNLSESLGMVLDVVKEKEDNALDEALDTLRYSLLFANIGRKFIERDENIKKVLEYLKKVGAIDMDFRIDDFIKSSARMSWRDQVNSMVAGTAHFIKEDKDYYYGICARHSMKDLIKGFHLWDRETPVGEPGELIFDAKVEFIKDANELKPFRKNFRDYAMFRVKKGTGKGDLPKGAVSVMPLKTKLNPFGIGLSIGFSGGKKLLEFYMINRYRQGENESYYRPTKTRSFVTYSKGLGKGTSGAGITNRRYEVVAATLRNGLRFTSCLAVLMDLIEKGNSWLVGDINDIQDISFITSAKSPVMSNINIRPPVPKGCELDIILKTLQSIESNL